MYSAFNIPDKFVWNIHLFVVVMEDWLVKWVAS